MGDEDLFDRLGTGARPPAGRAPEGGASSGRDTSGTDGAGADSFGLPGRLGEEVEGPCDPSPELDTRLGTLWEVGREDSRRAAEQYLRLALSWQEIALPEEGEDLEAADDGEAEVLAIALALRCTRAVAHGRIHDAHRAVTAFPRSFDRLHSGDLPAAWFEKALRRTRHLSDTDLAAVDGELSGWPLDLTAEQFGRRLSTLLTRLESRREIPAALTPEGRRRVEMLPVQADGTACLQVIGPVPEILALARSLDAGARAVQATQRHALENGEPLPHDPQGQAALHGRPLSLARLRYELLTGAELDTDGVDVSPERFRINVTVPMMTLLGASGEPGMLDGTIPVPAAQARELAGDSETWYRVLTDPATGVFLPLAAQRYAPTKSMLEHLRLRHATCAVPGCTRPSSWASECDHIQEYDHVDPTRGGLTEIENLHLLCWQHHRAKTHGRLDPVRVAAAPGEHGSTRWEIRRQARIRVRDDTDLATPATVAELESAWASFEHRRKERALVGRRSGHRARNGDGGPEPPWSDPPPF